MSDPLDIRAWCAMSVYHYDAVVQAQTQTFSDVNLLRRLEVTPRTAAAAGALPLVGSTLGRLLGRRARTPAEISGRTMGLGISQYAFPLAARLGITLGTDAVRAVYGAKSRAVARRVNDGDFLHFEEGHGLDALRTLSLAGGVMERRALHHLDVEAAVETFAGFPERRWRDPLRDVLAEEYELADAVMVYSQAQARSLAAHGVASSKIFVAPLPVHTARPSPADGGVAPDLTGVIFVGRLDAHKGIDVAVEAVRRAGAGLRLTVAGPAGAASREWLARQSNVDYLGILTSAELTRLYSTSTVLLLPSIESYGLVAMDAAAHGVRVLCRETTGAGEYLPAEICRVVPGRDPDHWAAALTDELSPQSMIPDRESRLRAWSRASGALSVDAVASQIEGHYRALLGPR